MNEVVAKLVSDMRWRFQRGGSKYKPKDKEVETWGAFNIHGLAPVMVSLLLLGLTAVLMDMGGGVVNDDLLPLLWVASVPLLYWLRSALNNRFKLRAYRKLLSDNERFMLVEYAKYLQRQIARAKDEPALGGAPEVRRLTELHARLTALLAQGAGRDAKPLRSDLADEAVLAEAMVESYTPGQGDGLAQLDARLPQELRQRIADLDRASDSQRPKVAQ